MITPSRSCDPIFRVSKVGPMHRIVQAFQHLANSIGKCLTLCFFLRGHRVRRQYRTANFTAARYCETAV